MVFDKVIGRDAPRRLRLSDKRHKYPLADYNMGLAYARRDTTPRSLFAAGLTCGWVGMRARPGACTSGNNITYSLHCSLIPNAGLLLSSRWGATTVRVPLQ